MDDLKAAHWLVERYGISVAWDPLNQRWTAYTTTEQEDHAIGDTWISAVLALADCAFSRLD